jgi:hypothetical protein
VKKETCIPEVDEMEKEPCRSWEDQPSRVVAQECEVHSDLHTHLKEVKGTFSILQFSL